MLLFQSTLPREERPGIVGIAIGVVKFQSTLPREERLLLNILPSSYAPYFNPRSHERSDLMPTTAVDRSEISIHAPTRGATVQMETYITNKKISIHAPTRGATPSRSLTISPISISIHAPTRGATCMSYHKAMRCRFQSTLPREERLYLFSLYLSVFRFQSTLPREERPLAVFGMIPFSIFQSTLPREERRLQQYSS